MSLPDWIKVIEEEPEELQAKAYLFNPDVSKSKLSSMSNDVQDVGRGVGRGAAGFVGSVPDMLSALIDLGARLPWNKKASTFEDVQNLLQKGGSENLKSLSGLKAPESFIGKTLERAGDYGQIGRASCRERV